MLGGHNAPLISNSLTTGFGLAGGGCHYFGGLGKDGLRFNDFLRGHSIARYGLQSAAHGLRKDFVMFWAGAKAKMFGRELTENRHRFLVKGGPFNQVTNGVNE
ncbi:hypothetical protein [Corynebacterium canis]|uniref:hypothetical protein n=1 Tax=Corynebacterium canis TaxID=679663 RepID=UPI001FE7F21C|nr:hypothetical protein [Corynebacterium canis]